MNEILGSRCIWNNIKALKAKKPLVHNITNFVTMDIVANSLLAIGASPIMAHACEEMEEMVKLSNALIINIGTLTPEWFESMMKALQIARSNQRPVVLDPVGAGATSYRTSSCKLLLEGGGITVVRGNASEILALANNRNTTKGVDSTQSSLEARGVAIQLAKEKNLTVVMSGSVDIITNGDTTYEVANGSSCMGKVTGMGCTASALIGGFLGSDIFSLSSSITAMIVMGIAGEKAALTTLNPGSFKIAFLDMLNSISENDIITGSKVKIYQS